MRKVYTDKIAELEAQLLVTATPLLPRASEESSRDTQFLVQQAIAETSAKLASLKKAHSRLLEKHTELEVEYQVLKSQLDSYQGVGLSRGGRYSSTGERASFGTSDYDVISDYICNPKRDPQSSLRGAPISPPLSAATMHRTAGLTFQSAETRTSSRSSEGLAAFNKSKPLTQEETKSFFSDGSGSAKKEKIQPDSSVRVYGRGKNAQRICRMISG